MKKTLLLSTFSVALCVVVSGCDLSDGSKGGSTSQTGDTVIVDLPIAYIKRPVPIGLEDEDDLQVSILSEDVMDPAAFRPGAKLIIKNRAAVSAPERVITDRIYPAIQPQPTENNPTPEAIEQLYDVRDLSPNSDGTRLVFSMRAPEIPGADDDMQPAWHIWEYDLAADELTQVTTGSLVVAGHSRFPVYLPDESIVYSSTRQRDSKALLSDQGRPQYSYVTERDDEILAFTLHRIDADRENIEQISFGKGHDFYPTVLSDGRILFLRGDDTSGANDDRLSLYTMNPDGSNLSLHYGFHSPSGEDIAGQGALIRPLELPDGRIMVTYKSRQTNLLGGDIYAVDTETFIDNMQPTAANINTSGPAEASLSVGEVIIDNQSPHGYFNSAFPLFDGTGRLLVSWMPCTVQGYRFDIYVRRVDTDILDADDVVIGVDTTYELINIDGELVNSDGALLAVGAPAVEIPFDEVRALPCTISTFDKEYIRPSEPQYGIWVYDPIRGTQDPVVFANELGTIYTEAVALAPRTQPVIIPGPGADAFTRQLVDENVGVIHIRSIYDMDGQDSTADGIAAMADPLRTDPDSRPVRFVRFLEEANMPHEDEYEIDRGLVRGRGNQNGKSIIGYSEVHPDGSVMSKVPANVPFTMEFLDANGRRVTGPLGARHRNWINLRPGEVRTCNGCHTAASTLPHGRADAEPEPANQGALAPVNFTNTLLRNSEGVAYTLVPEVGETMAEFFVRARLEDPLAEDDTDPLAPSIDIVYTDAWTDPASGATPGEDIAFQYGNPEFPGPTNLLTQVPVRIGACLTEWSAICRVVIDYPAHIQPIFEVPRMLGDENITCINCHSTADLDGNAQVPAPDMGNLQLDFTPVVSMLDDMEFLKGYDELMAAGDPLFSLDPVTGELRIQLIQVVIGGVPQFQTQPLLDENGSATFQATNLAGDQICVALDTMEPDITFILDEVTGLNIPCMEYVYYVNADGLFTDAEGNILADQTNPIRVPLFEPNLQTRYLNPSAGANANQNRRFFTAFSTGGAHEGYLTAAELKLFSEWLDVGGQYYNEIFKALED